MEKTNYLLQLLKDFIKDYDDVNAKIEIIEKSKNYDDILLFNYKLIRDSFASTISEITKEINKRYK